MGICNCSCVYTSLQNEQKSSVKIEDLDKNEHKENFIQNEKEFAINEQKIINNLVSNNFSFSLNKFNQISTKNSLINSIDLSNKHSHSENQQSKSFSRNTFSSLSVKRKPIFEKLKQKSSKS